MGMTAAWELGEPRLVTQCLSDGFGETSRTSAAGTVGGEVSNVLSRKTVDAEKCARHHVCTISVFFLIGRVKRNG